MLALLLLAAVHMFLGQLTSTGLQAGRDRRTVMALAQAKEALIAYAVTYGDAHPDKVPGYLPCPEATAPTSTAKEGSADPSCGAKNVSVMGRLPWKTLGLEPLRDGAGECLWYAVSGTYKSNPATDMMNWDTNGLFAVFAAHGVSPIYGSGPENRAAAVIFAPGAVVGSQNRNSVANTAVCGGNYAPSNYLEASGSVNNAVISPTAGAVTEFVAGSRDGDSNDRLLVITPQDIFDAIERRSDFAGALADITARIARCVAAYGTRNAAGGNDRRLPWPAPTALSDYLANAAYDDRAGGLFGRLPFQVGNSKEETGNDMIGNNLVSGANCPEPWSALDDAWYKNWKDHLFYALSAAFSPSAATPSACPDCLSANGIGPYAAIVMFAGKKLAVQARAGSVEKASASNYLEGRNSANGPNTGGNSDYMSGTDVSDFNDVLYCIDPALNVLPCR